jgi:type II secretory pathway component HofQ
VRQTRERLDRVNGALVAAAARQEENDLAAQEATEEAAWRKAEKLARARQDVGVEINVLILKLADYWIELLQLGEELYEAAPVCGAKLHNSPMARANVEKALRLYLFKSKFKWATSYP